jgi:uncharacterized membrane protein YcaP (DUF421 family)
MITLGELKSQLREHGIKDVKSVKVGYLESDGHFSFIQKESNEKK